MKSKAIQTFKWLGKIGWLNVWAAAGLAILLGCLGSSGWLAILFALYSWQPSIWIFDFPSRVIPLAIWILAIPFFMSSTILSHLFENGHDCSRLHFCHFLYIPYLQIGVQAFLAASLLAIISIPVSFYHSTSIIFPIMAALCIFIFLPAIQAVVLKRSLSISRIAPLFGVIVLTLLPLSILIIADPIGYILMFSAWLFFCLPFWSAMAVTGDATEKSERHFPPIVGLLGWLLAALVLIVFTEKHNQTKQQIDLQSAIQEGQQLKLTTYTRHVLRDPSISGNGAHFYLKLLGKKSNGDKYFSGIDLWDLAELKRIKQLSRLTLILDKYQPEINTIRQATQHTDIQFPTEFDIDIKARQSPDYVTAHHLSQLMLADAVRQCENNHYQEGIEIFLDTIRFGQDIGHRGFLTDALTGISIQKNALKHFGPYLATLELSSNDYQVILPQMKHLLNTPNPMQNALEQDKLLTVIELLNTQKTALQTANVDLENTDAFLQNTWLYLSFMFYRPALTDAVEVYRDVIQTVAQQLEKQPTQRQAWNLSGIRKRNFLLGTVLPDFMAIADNIQISQTVLIGLYIQTALRSYLQQQGHYPAKLDALQPSIISQIPLDPFSGNYFIYRNTHNGYKLYSVGLNGRDDGGQRDLYHINFKTETSPVFEDIVIQ